MCIEDYIQQNYLSDLEIFLGSKPRAFGPSGMLCGTTISENLSEYRRLKFTEIATFFCCQYALNLINCSIQRNFCVNYREWLSNTPPFADCTACDLMHGGVRSPLSVLEYLLGHHVSFHLPITEALINEAIDYFVNCIDQNEANNCINKSFRDALSQDKDYLEYCQYWKEAKS